MTRPRHRTSLIAACLAASALGLAGGCGSNTTSTGQHVPFVADAEKARAEEYQNRGKQAAPGRIPKNVRTPSVKK